MVFILTLSLPSWSQHTTWIGKVVGVSDGDTITVMHNVKAEKIRLYGIDCPEKRQAFGKRAKQFTSSMVFGRIVEVRPITTDRYGRTIAWIYFDGACLNEELLKVGLAWHYKRYSSGKHLAELETEARQKKAGLWSDPYPVPRGTSDIAKERLLSRDYQSKKKPKLIVKASFTTGTSSPRNFKVILQVL